jgi:hypothetical protein
MSMCKITNKEVRETRMTEDNVPVDASLHRLCTIKLGTALLTSSQIKDYMEKRTKAVNVARGLVFIAITDTREKGMDRPYNAINDMLKRENAIALHTFKAEAQTLNLEQSIVCMEVLQQEFSHLKPVTWWQENDLVTQLLYKFISKKHWFLSYQ